MVRISYTFILAAFLLFPSCTKRVEVYHQDDAQDLWRLYEARLYDIPIAIKAQPLSQYHTYIDDENAIQLGYITRQSKDSIIKFYQQEMERMGWLHIGIVRGYEVVMHFEKPRRFCSISLREDEQKRHSLVVISIGFKG